MDNISIVKVCLTFHLMYRFLELKYVDFFINLGIFDLKLLHVLPNWTLAGVASLKKYKKKDKFNF